MIYSKHLKFFKEVYETFCGNCSMNGGYTDPKILKWFFLTSSYNIKRIHKSREKLREIFIELSREREEERILIEIHETLGIFKDYCFRRDICCGERMRDLYERIKKLENSIKGKRHSKVLRDFKHY